MIKIGIGVPTQGTIKTKTAFSIIEMIRLNPKLEFLPIFRFGGYIGENKAKIVDIAQQALCSHLLFIDHDMKFAPNLITKLLYPNKSVIGAMYYYRYLPLEPMLKFFNKDGKPVHNLKDSVIGKIPNKIFEVYAVAGGCLLIDMHVFNKIKKPYFGMEQDEEGNRSLTEDIAFFEKARAVGDKVWCDPTLGVKHCGEYEY